MPIYSFQCAACGYSFDRYSAVEDRDIPAPCDQCGSGAERVFLPSLVNIPEGFAQWDRSSFDLTLDQCHAREKANEAYLAGKPKSKPTYEECLKSELDVRGIRHPHRLIDDSQAAKIDLAHRMKE